MCPDGRYRRAVYLLGPYIADYPEQVILAGVVSGWCVRCVSPPTYARPVSHLRYRSCASSPTNLDQPNPILRSKEHTNACKAAFDSKTLWEKYGIVGGVTVSYSPVHRTNHHLTPTPSRSPNTFPTRTSTNSSLLTCFTNSSRACSKTILLSGSLNISRKSMERRRVK